MARPRPEPKGNGIGYATELQAWLDEQNADRRAREHAAEVAAREAESERRRQNQRSAVRGGG